MSASADTTKRESQVRRLRLGLLVNPVAGVGGPAALKGSDGEAVQAQARASGSEPRASVRARQALDAFDARSQVSWLTAAAPMGADVLASVGIEGRVCFEPGDPTQQADTTAAAAAMLRAGVDLIVFAGGDGTARDLLEAVGNDVPVLGVPAGVKMHSGVFATTPSDAGALLDDLVSGGLVAARSADVRDIDEAALRRGEIGNRFFGEMRVPDSGGYLQHTKVAGRESEELAVVEIVADLAERFASEDRPLVIGPGSTLAQFKRTLGVEPTLLGFDVVGGSVARALDADRATLDRLASERPIVLLSFSRGQGFLIGRGNQQLSPALLSGLSREDLVVVGSRSKLATLGGRPLLVDSGDPKVDEHWSGLVELTAGYEDRLFYRLSATLAPQNNTERGT